LTTGDLIRSQSKLHAKLTALSSREGSRRRMIIDLEANNCLPTLDADICVVGAGPAGITIAQQLVGKGLRICLAESGGFVEEPRTQRLYDGECVGHPMSLTEGRCRVFGGSSTQWTGRSATLDPVDFEERSWIQNSGWPISWQSLQPYYDRARALGAFGWPWLSDADAVFSIRRTMPRFSTTNLVPFIWRGAPPHVAGRRAPG
jgi:choline dehydrogenase-like flavoprotein